MTDFPTLLGLLSDGGVRYVIVGGLAARVHGSARLTSDLDLVYSRDPENLRRIVSTLAPHRPYLRGAPPGLPFLWDAETLRRGLNFTLVTDLGELDLLGEMAGAGRYEQLVERAVDVELFGRVHRCVDLATLIAAKRAAGRPKDLEAVAELELIRAEREEP